MIIFTTQNLQVSVVRLVNKRMLTFVLVEEFL